MRVARGRLVCLKPHVHVSEAQLPELMLLITIPAWFSAAENKEAANSSALEAAAA